MKQPIIRCLLAAALAVTTGAIQAQPTAQYIPGVEGVKGSTLPPPGWYFRDYNYFYVSDQLNDANGDRNSAGPPNFRAETYANVPRLLWITDTKLLGGNLGADALLPLVYESIRAGGYNHASFGIGDLFAESTLTWHPKQFDLAVGCGSWVPTGDSSRQPTTRAGLGYWTPMLTLGGTWYPDAAKTWSVSALSRYEISTEQRDSHDTRGQAYTLEWGISKAVLKMLDAGVVGYYQQKTTRDTGSDPDGLTNFKQDDRVAAIGPEIGMAFPDVMLFVTLRYEYEFLAESRAQGHTAVLTVTKRF
jgi:hypothetical protein